jgi:hypothetical protein
VSEISVSQLEESPEEEESADKADILPYQSRYKDQPLESDQINLMQRDHEDKSPAIYQKALFENETIMQ